MEASLQRRHHEHLSFATGVSIVPPGVPCVASCALLELLEHERFFGNLQCVTVAPTASGFSRTLFLFLLLEEELDVHEQHMGFFDHVEHLVLQIPSRVPPFFDFRF